MFILFLYSRFFRFETFKILTSWCQVQRSWVKKKNKKTLNIMIEQNTRFYSPSLYNSTNSWTNFVIFHSNLYFGSARLAGENSRLLFCFIPQASEQSWSIWLDFPWLYTFVHPLQKWPNTIWGKKSQDELLLIPLQRSKLSQFYCHFIWNVEQQQNEWLGWQFYPEESG